MKRPENISPEVWQQIEANIYNSQKIVAIKLYREATNSGLKESKDAIDGFSQIMKTENPTKFSPKKAGCGPTLFLFSILPCIYYFWH